MERRVITASTLVAVLAAVLGGFGSFAEKLSPDQKAPPFAKGSGGLILKAPFEGGAADVGRRGTQQQQQQQQPNPAPPAAPSGAAAKAVADDGSGIVREETEELKEVDGQLVRVVKGSFTYDSPEGLPISVKYVADENGNRASFTFGTGKPGAGGSRSSGGGGGGGGGKTKKPGITPGGSSATSLGGGGSSGGDGGGGRLGGAGGAVSGGSGGGQGGASTYLPPTTKVDRSYLPPN